MTLVRFITPLDARAIVAHGWGALRLLAAILIPPALVALLAGELTSALIFAGLSGAVFVAGRRFAPAELPELETREAVILTVVMYLVFSGVGALAFLPVATPLDGFFESVSGFTTTGLSVLDVETLPTSLLFFRSYAQWIGGAGISVLSLVVLAGPGQAAFRMYASQGGRENLVGSVVATTRIVMKIYLTLTGVGWMAFVATGMSPFDGLLHVLSTVSTGGFSPHVDSMATHAGAATRLVVMLFMLLGATALPLYHGSRRALGNVARDPQARVLVTIVLAATLLGLAYSGWSGWSLLPGAFHTVSALTTTGFTVTTSGTWPDGVRQLAMLLMFIGGSVGSTAGGIKLLRLILLLKLCGWLLVRASLPPEARTPLKYRGAVVADAELKYVFGFVGLYLAAAVGSSIALTLAGFPSRDALFESLSALGTVGLSAGVTSSHLASWAKLLLCFDMLAGRLEILPLLLLVFPYSWRARRRRA